MHLARQDQFTLPIRHVVCKRSFVDLTRLEGKFALATSLALLKCTLIHIAILCRFYTLAMRHIIDPATLEGSTTSHDQLAFA